MAVFISLGLLVFVFACIWVLTHLRYHIGSRYLRITLFGITLRRISLDDIESVSKRRPSGWTEHWWSTIRPNHRMLFIRRSRGLRKYLVVTPKNRYIFKADLERAMKRKLAVTETSAESMSQVSDCPT